jgi:hypothetical protein
MIFIDVALILIPILTMLMAMTIRLIAVLKIVTIQQFDNVLDVITFYAWNMMNMGTRIHTELHV